MTEILSSLPTIVMCLLVCAAKIVEITIQSLKTCMMVKGERLKAAGLGFIECVLWGLVISGIIGTLGDDYFLLVFYCIGYATGLYLGATIENKIALGTSNLELIASDESTEKITEYLQQNMEKLHFIAGFLMKYETMDEAQFKVAMERDDITYEELDDMVAEKRKISEAENEAKRQRDEEDRKKKEMRHDERDLDYREQLRREFKADLQDDSSDSTSENEDNTKGE